MSPHRCLLDRSEQRGSGLREDKEDLSVSPSRAKVSQRREGNDASWWKWCKSPGPVGNTELMWVTSAKASKQGREGGHVEDVTPQIRSKAATKTFATASPHYPDPLPHYRWRFKTFQRRRRHARRQTDLIDDGEEGVDEHQVVLLQRQVVCLLQSKQHRANQGDLSGALN